MGWAIVGLVILNLSTLLTIVYQQVKTPGAESSGITIQPGAGDLSDKYSGRYFRDQLNFTNEQMEQFRQVNPRYRPVLRGIALELAKKRESMLLEMASPKTDTLALNALSDSIGYLHRDLKKFTYRYYLELKGICDPEQQKKLEAMFGEVFSKDGATGTSGNGAQHRWQYGRQSRN